MRLWKRASGVLKDQTSLWHANLSRRTAGPPSATPTS
ncbi:hypothetical protein OROGR_010373 [Orobanche gracilis]